MSGLTILIRMDSLCRKCLNNVPYEKKVIFIFMCAVVRFVYEFKFLFTDRCGEKWLAPGDPVVYFP